MPAKRFFEKKLSERERASVLETMRKFARSGPQSLSNERFKGLGKGLYEFKSYQIRFVGGYGRPGEFLVARGLKKKQDRHKGDDLEAAQKILDQHRADEG